MFFSGNQRGRMRINCVILQRRVPRRSGCDVLAMVEPPAVENRILVPSPYGKPLSEKHQLMRASLRRRNRLNL